MVINLQGVQTDVHQLKEGVTVRVSWLEEDGVLDVLKRSFVQMMFDVSPSSMSRCCICEDV